MLRRDTVGGASWELRGRGPVHDLEVAGELDLASVPELRETTRDVAGPGAVLCDLTRVSFADTTCVHWLLELHDAAARQGGVLLVVVRAAGTVERLLDLALPAGRLAVHAEA